MYSQEVTSVTLAPQPNVQFQVELRHPLPPVCVYEVGRGRFSEHSDDSRLLHLIPPFNGISRIRLYIARNALVDAMLPAAAGPHQYFSI